MAYSLAKIAKELGISKSTVSLILNGRAAENRISKELEANVLDFCRKVNYAPNIHAIRATSKFAKNVGLLINEQLLADEGNPFSDQNISEITGGIVATAAKHGFRTTIQFYNRSTKDRDVFHWLRDREIDGLIYYGTTFDAQWHRCFLEEKRCVVGIGIRPDEGIATINLNHAASMQTLTEHILQQGKTRLIFVGGSVDSYVSEQRLAGVTAALSAHGLPLHHLQILTADFSEERAYRLFLEYPVCADAILCANDDMAIGVMRALQQRGYLIPDMVCVTGADGIKIGRYVKPALTTIENKNTELGKCAMEELLRLLHGEPPQNRILEGTLHFRASCP